MSYVGPPYVHFPKKWIPKLVSLPEWGMGWQKVDVHFKNGLVIHGVIVLNCEETIDARLLNVDLNDIIDITEA